jgi:hypothetical protein
LGASWAAGALFYFVFVSPSDLGRGEPKIFKKKWRDGRKNPSEFIILANF